MANLVASYEMKIATSNNGKVMVGTNVMRLENVTTANVTDVINLDATKIMSIKNSTVTADNVTLNFSSCTTLENANLTARNGGVIRFPQVESYTGTGNRTWEANGMGSRIEMSALTRISHSNTLLYIRTNTRGGGVIDLSKLITVDRLNVDSRDNGSPSKKS